MVQTKFGAKRKFLQAGVAATVLAGTVALYAAPRSSRDAATQEKDSARDTSGGPSTSLNDQTDLSVTVYHSNIPLIRHVPNLSLPTHHFRLKLMDIAAT